MREFVCLPLIWFEAPGVSPSDFGSSGTFVKNKSSLTLKSSILQFLVFLRDLGKLLKSLGPDTWKLWFLNVWTWALPLFLAGIAQSLPFLSECEDQLTPQLGLKPSNIFHT